MEIQGKLFLAPMAGTADYAFRSICRSLGADIVCSEMVSAKATLYGDRKSAELAFLRDDERPAGIQLFGSEPDVMAKAAERVAVYRPLYIDINMGCPVHKVFANGEGSALMRDVPKAAALIRAVVEATDIPVGVKMRLGVDSATRSAPALAEAAERAGAAFLTVHGRTRAQMYAGKADLDGIAEVVRAVGIPVVGNGDVTDAASAARMYAHTDCAAVMVGRGALGNPWVFRELACARAGEPFVPPTNAEKKAVVRAHLTRLVETKGAWALPEYPASISRGTPRDCPARPPSAAASTALRRWRKSTRCWTKSSLEPLQFLSKLRTENLCNRRKFHFSYIFFAFLLTNEAAKRKIGASGKEFVEGILWTSFLSLRKTIPQYARRSLPASRRLWPWRTS